MRVSLIPEWTSPFEPFKLSRSVVRDRPASPQVNSLYRAMEVM